MFELTPEQKESLPKVTKSLAEEYPQFVIEYVDGSKAFDLAALMRWKGYF